MLDLQKGKFHCQRVSGKLRLWQYVTLVHEIHETREIFQAIHCCFAVKKYTVKICVTSVKMAKGY